MIEAGNKINAAAIEARLEEIRAAANSLGVGIRPGTIGPDAMESPLVEIHPIIFRHTQPYLGTVVDYTLDHWYVVNSNGTTGGGQEAECTLSAPLDLDDNYVIRVEYDVCVKEIRSTGTLREAYRWGVALKLQVMAGGGWDDVEGSLMYMQSDTDPTASPAATMAVFKVMSGIDYITKDMYNSAISKVRLMLTIFCDEPTKTPDLAVDCLGVSFTVEAKYMGVG